LVQQAAGEFQDQNVIQPVPFQLATAEEDDVLQLAYVDEA